ncbi:hypothetical protein [Almyronema epifaneia]|uniref:Uncharacterized protein n=1 Tax=Almyronema epifaneia S1 TaxID=2991925 RepID=A0ABW6IGJ2_9CYAN
MVRLWLLCLVLIFALAEGYQWIVHLDGLAQLQGPLSVAGGILLAIASNYQRFKQTTTARQAVVAEASAPNLDAPPTCSTSTIGYIPACLESATPPAAPPAQPPALTPQSQRSISFEIRQPTRLQWQAFKPPSQPPSSD